eukprot:10649386-Alexandrium_andersonii.AAC.1
MCIRDSTCARPAARTAARLPAPAHAWRRARLGARAHTHANTATFVGGPTRRWTFSADLGFRPVE